ncbi:hypothetical protein [Ornithinimicrobium kibberense]|uniref:hypothetical protein n=1 Tax=Ornithinimicrobium kibberense TaxID=282060 RepID=UPI00361972E2
MPGSGGHPHTVTTRPRGCPQLRPAPSAVPYPGGRCPLRRPPTGRCCCAPCAT